MKRLMAAIMCLWTVTIMAEDEMPPIRVPDGKGGTYLVTKAGWQVVGEDGQPRDLTKEEAAGAAGGVVEPPKNLPKFDPNRTPAITPKVIEVQPKSAGNAQAARRRPVVVKKAVVPPPVVANASGATSGESKAVLWRREGWTLSQDPDTRVIEADERITGDVQESSGTMVIRGTVDGNVLIVNGTVFVEGEVNGKVVGRRSDVTILGTVNGDVDLGAGTLRLAGTVNGNVKLNGTGMERAEGFVLNGDLVQ